MDHDAIAEIGIDDKGCLYVTPLTRTFPYAYREAMEINWHEKGHYLHAPPPPRAQLAQPITWFWQILDAAKAQGCELHLKPETKWHNLPIQLREEISSATGGSHA